MVPQLSNSLGEHGESLDDVLAVTRPRRILVAEDDREMRRLVVSMLTRDGYQVIEARDGLELLSFIGSLLLSSRDTVELDVVISDVRMPGQSGIDILAGLRRADWATPFILITAFGSPELHQEARRLGAAAVFDKPFELDKLRATVQNLAPTFGPSRGGL